MSEKDIVLPRAAGRFIAEHSLDVKVLQDGIEKAAKKACMNIMLLSFGKHACDKQCYITISI